MILETFKFHLNPTSHVPSILNVKKKSNLANIYKIILMGFANSQTVLVKVTWKFEDSFLMKIKRLARSVFGLE